MVSDFHSNLKFVGIFDCSTMNQRDSGLNPDAVTDENQRVTAMQPVFYFGYVPNNLPNNLFYLYQSIKYWRSDVKNNKSRKKIMNPPVVMHIADKESVSRAIVFAQSRKNNVNKFIDHSRCSLFYALNQKIHSDLL